jgi:hypothetical protein
MSKKTIFKIFLFVTQMRFKTKAETGPRWQQPKKIPLFTCLNQTINLFA